MNKFQNQILVRDEIIKRIPKEISIFISISINTLKPKEGEIYAYYRFLLSKEGRIRNKPLQKKDFQNTKDLYKQIIHEFLEDKLLIFYKDNTKQIGHGNDAYLGMCLQNEKGEILNLYYSGNALFLYNEMKKEIEKKKQKDFLKYGEKNIKEQTVERIVFYPSVDDRSSILYIEDNEEYDNYHKRIQNQLGYYYKKTKYAIEEKDIQNIVKIIRMYINTHIFLNPKYKYSYNAKFQTTGLVIYFENGYLIDIKDLDLIEKIEKKGIIDDLWLVMHQLTDKMPEKNASFEEKELLLVKKKKYLQRKKSDL